MVFTTRLKAYHCLRGRHLLYDYCQEKSVDFQKCGKLIVALDASEVEKIDLIYRHGQSIGVDGLSMLGGVAVRELEPSLNCKQAILSSETGIIDSHGLMSALRADLEADGGVVAFFTIVSRI